MPKKEPRELIVGLRGRPIGTFDDFCDRIVLHIDRRGVFAQGDVGTRAFRSAFGGGQSRLIVHRAG
ncbi:hypothetical protein ACWD3I_11245 [Streptomyces sp. NPDC002817]|uniref:hypothetical protein n=1 Tax=Streptomyces sp. NPDC088357 TaxID=3154655 RepID=UPI003434800A